MHLPTRTFSLPSLRRDGPQPYPFASSSHAESHPPSHVPAHVEETQQHVAVESQQLPQSHTVTQQREKSFLVSSSSSSSPSRCSPSPSPHLPSLTSNAPLPEEDSRSVLTMQLIRQQQQEQEQQQHLQKQELSTPNGSTAQYRLRPIRRTAALPFARRNNNLSHRANYRHTPRKQISLIPQDLHQQRCSVDAIPSASQNDVSPKVVVVEGRRSEGGSVPRPVTNHSSTSRRVKPLAPPSVSDSNHSSSFGALSPPPQLSSSSSSTPHHHRLSHRAPTTSSQRVTTNDQYSSQVLPPVRAIASDHQNLVQSHSATHLGHSNGAASQNVIIQRNALLRDGTNPRTRLPNDAIRVTVSTSPTNISNSGTVSAASSPSPADTLRRPILYYAKYGAPNSWSLDVFTLPHNAVRAECVDLYNILESIHARSHRVCVLELEEFFIWWAAFEGFLIEYFDFEADVLFPWVFPVTAVSENAFSLPGVATRKTNADFALRNSLLTRKDGLLDSIRQLNGTFELRRHVDTTDVFQTILEEVNEFVPKLLEYFHIQERHLPPIAMQLYSSSSKDVVIRKYVQYIKRGEAPQRNLVLLTRWMDGDSRDKWVRSHVRGYWRLVHRRLERRCHRTHGIIAVRFHKRLQRSVRSVAASRLRRRTEFGEEIDELSFGSFPSYGGSVRSLSLAMGARSMYKGRDQRSTDASRPKTRLRT